MIMFSGSYINIDLVSLFRWKETGWKNTVFMKPDVTVTLRVSESYSGKRWKVDTALSSVTVDGDLVDPSLKDRIADAVKRRCDKDLTVIQIFGDSLRRGDVKRGMAGGNMFKPTDYKVNFNHRYGFVMALDGVSIDKVDGIYLVPSYLPAPVNVGYDEDPFYKMCCYERIYKDDSPATESATADA